MSFLTRTFSRLFGASAASTTSVLTPVNEDFFTFMHDQDQHQTKTITTPEDKVDVGMLFVLVSDHFKKITSFDNDEVCHLGDFAGLAYLDCQANVDAGGAAYNVPAFATDILLGYMRTQGHNVVLTYKAHHMSRPVTQVSLL